LFWCLVVWFVGWLVGWFVGWGVGWFVGWGVGRVVGLVNFYWLAIKSLKAY